MLIAGAILLVVAVVALLVARPQRAKARAARLTETLSCADLAQLAQAVDDTVGAGNFRQRCEVVGDAAAGPEGQLTAPHSGAQAVWHRSTVIHRYWEMETRRVDNRTERRRVERESTVSDITSTTPFTVVDGTGSVAVFPEGAKIDEPERVVDRFEPHTGSQGSRGLADALVSVLRAGADSGTLGFRHQEWIIRPGTRLFVHGEVSDANGRLAFTKPEKGRFIVSTRSEEELVGEAERIARWSTIGAAVAAVAGVALLIAGLVA
jgi:hypothetical protein